MAETGFVTLAAGPGLFCLGRGISSPAHTKRM